MVAWLGREQALRVSWGLHLAALAALAGAAVSIVAHVNAFATPWAADDGLFAAACTLLTSNNASPNTWTSPLQDQRLGRRRRTGNDPRRRMAGVASDVAPLDARGHPSAVRPASGEPWMRSREWMQRSEAGCRTERAAFGCPRAVQRSIL